MSDQQLAALEELVLIPLSDACTSDGYEYLQLTTLDRDNSRAVYRDTGCSTLRVEGAMAMLPQRAFSNAPFPFDSAGSCPD